MKQESRWARRALLLLASAASWAGTLTAASAQAPEPQVLAPVVALGKPDAVPSSDLGNPALQREVSLEAMSQPLAEAVAALAAQGEVTLKIDPAQAARLPPQCRVTMRVRALPLGQVLASLAELYGGQWRKVGEQSFAWLPSGDASGVAGTALRRDEASLDGNPNRRHAAAADRFS